MTDIEAILADAKPAERTLPLCLRGDLVAQFEDLERQLTEAQRNQDDSLNAGTAARGIADQMEALREQMQAGTVVFRLRSMGRKRFQALCAEHPPRKDDDGNPLREDRLGVNTQTVWDPVLRASLVEPVLAPDRLTHILDEVLSDGQYDRLASLAWDVNRSDVDVPFSLAASRLIRNSASESSQPVD